MKKPFKSNAVKKIVACLLALTMVLALMPFVASADPPSLQVFSVGAQAMVTPDAMIATGTLQVTVNNQTNDPIDGIRIIASPTLGVHLDGALNAAV